MQTDKIGLDAIVGVVQTLFIIIKSLPLVRGYAAREQAKLVVGAFARPGPSTHLASQPDSTCGRSALLAG